MSSCVVVVLVVEIIASDVDVRFLDVIVVFGCGADVSGDDGL